MTNEVQPPCVKCRHAETCTLPPTCHALRYFTQTGLPITPPRRNPCPQIEMKKSPSPPPPAPKPCITKSKHIFTNTRLEALAGLHHEREKNSHG